MQYQIREDDAVESDTDLEEDDEEDSDWEEGDSSDSDFIPGGQGNRKGKGKQKGGKGSSR